MDVQRINQISLYKAKVTMKDNQSVNYGAVYSAVSGIDAESKKTLMSTARRDMNGGFSKYGKQ